MRSGEKDMPATEDGHAGSVKGRFNIAQKLKVTTPSTIPSIKLSIILSLKRFTTSPYG